MTNEIQTCKKSDIENLECSICLSILVEPVLLPCRHKFCLSCINDNLQFNSPVCPYCRKRYGSWFRKATKHGELIDKDLWSYIRKNRKYLQQRQKTGEGEVENSSRLPDGITAPAVTGKEPSANLSKPGEIHKEYEKELKKFREELEKEKQNELNATLGYIIKEFAEISDPTQDKSNLNNINKMLVASAGHTPYALSKPNCSSKNNLSLLQASTSGGPIASTSNRYASSSVISVPSSSSSSTNLSRQQQTNTKCGLMKSFSIKLNNGKEYIKHTVHKTILSKIGSPFSPGSKLHTVPPTSIHRSPTRNTDSTDSLKAEMCHFKPIRTCPVTPSKRMVRPVITTPKAERIFNADIKKIIRSPRTCHIPDNLSSPSKCSAFCYLASPEKKLPPTPSSSPLSTQKKSAKQKTPTQPRRRGRKRKNTAQDVVDKPEVSPPTPVSKDDSGSTVSPENGRRRSKRIRNCHENTISNEFKLPEATILSRVIDEQKKCEEMIKQELKDFKLAKKLQAELQKNISPASPRKTRRRTAKEGQFDKTDNGVIPPKKRTRPNSQKSQMSESSSIAVEDKTSNNRFNLRRRSKRTTN